MKVKVKAKAQNYEKYLLQGNNFQTKRSNFLLFYAYTLNYLIFLHFFFFFYLTSNLISFQHLYCKQSSHTDILYSLRSGKAPLQNITVYAGYAFTGMSLAVLAGIFYSLSDSIALTGLYVCVGFFLVKNMKRVVFEEVKELREAFYHQA